MFLDGQGVTRQTRLRHKNIVLALRNATSWMEVLQRQKAYAQERGISAASSASLLRSTIGALKTREIYLFPDDPLMSVPSRPPKLFSQAIAHYTALARVEERAQPALSRDDAAAVGRRLRPNVQAWLRFQLAWLCAARMTSIRRIRRTNLLLNHVPKRLSTATPSATIRFVEGKTISATGSYSVHVEITADLEAALARLSHTGNSFIFRGGKIGERADAEITAAIRDQLQNPNATVRAIRRGALQCMAREGVPSTTMLKFSQHTTESALMHYLLDGVYHYGDAQNMMEASRILQISA